MSAFHTWLICDPSYASVLDEVSVTDEISVSTADDPSFRHWFKSDGGKSSCLELANECTLEQETIQSSDSIRGKEVIINCTDEETANNFLSLIHGSILLGYPMNLDFEPVSSICTIDDIEADFLRRKPFHKWFTYHDNVCYGVLLAARAWSDRPIKYAIHKWRLSLDLDCFTPHSASPAHGQVFPTHYPDDRYHVKAAFAAIAAFSAIEELGLEVRSSQDKHRFIGDRKDSWNPEVLHDLKKRSEAIGVDATEDFEWILRGERRRFEDKLKPILGTASSRANGEDVRDRTLSIADAIHYASIIRNFIAAHKFDSLVGELGPYDVFNTQSIARRLILSSLSAWMKDVGQIVEEDQNSEQSRCT